ncbi:MAG TPA: NUDIX domain-containing protein [Gemmataceae bacterium]|nr:NUDIX domain-containing protein [Gemmataceae bacterium]
MNPDPGNELVDVIDAAGLTIATVTRREMRERRLPHRCIYILVFNQNGNLFVHLRTATKDVYPSHWDVAVGGVLAAGESFAEGALREIYEELGIESTPEPLFPFEYADASTGVRSWAYRICHDGPFRLQPEEIVRGEFVGLQEAVTRSTQDPFCPDGLAVFAEYRKRLAFTP